MRAAQGESRGGAQIGITAGASHKLGSHQGQLETGHQAESGKLTDDDIDVVAGHSDPLAGKIQERYGLDKNEAEKQLAAWESMASDSWFTQG